MKVTFDVKKTGGNLGAITARLRERIEKTVDQEAQQIVKDFEGTTSNWQHKVKFNIEKHSTVGGIEAKVFTTDQIYRFVNDGTAAHIIRAKGLKSLAFATPFLSKTWPGMLNFNGGFVGNKKVFAKEVHHPGTIARKFDKLISAKARPRFRKIMKEVLKTPGN